MSCKFSIHYPHPKTQLIEQLDGAMKKISGEFYGDTNNGAFKGKTPLGGFGGSYIVENDTIHVTIEKKPFLVSCSRIEEEINNYLNIGTA